MLKIFEILTNYERRINLKFKDEILKSLNFNLKSYLNFNLNKIYTSRSSRSLHPS